ncbi:phosphatase PAP2 family protein [Bacillus sp. FJAT-27264]|uniref:phosphatase PAP2 family protein n=1 Tax=Paenibacillus sp. (strain DSM 101736 / FJAT-27264) TaxID=1850362 RepID=UPI000A7F279B|nr:phosphatase PAP2 family protein [Bacillus sp. FJAT-27264]
MLLHVQTGGFTLNYRQWPRGYRLFIWFALVFGLIAAWVTLGNVSSFDNPIIHTVQSMESPTLTALAKMLSLVGSSRLAIGISVLTIILLYFLLKHRMELLLFIWVGLGSQLLNSLMKQWFHRERPNIHRIIQEVGYSFPSGHSMAAFSLYGVIAYLLWRHLNRRRERAILVILAVLMTGGIGWSRIYLGVHYPSDVIGGYAASGAWLMLSIGWFESYRFRIKRTTAA